MTTFRYDNTSPMGVLSQAAEYVFQTVMPEPHWNHEPDHAQAMLFTLRVHGHLGIRMSMVESDNETSYRLTGVQGEDCLYEEAAGLMIELRPDDGGRTAVVVAGTDAKLIWLMMMVDVALDFVRHRCTWPSEIGVNWRACHVHGETETWPDWFLISEVAA